MVVTRRREIVGVFGGMVLAWVAVSACSAPSTVDGGTATDIGPACALATFDRSCTGPADCTVGVRHGAACGVPEALVGIRRTELARFQAADVACSSPIDAGCAGVELVTDDGTHSTPDSLALYFLQCTSGVCRTSSSTYPDTICGCAAHEVCFGGNGGCFSFDAGLGPSTCFAIPPTCASCDCLPTDACGGTCLAVVPGVGSFCSCRG